MSGQTAPRPVEASSAAAAVVTPIVTGGLTFVAGWLTRHTPRGATG